MSQKKDCWDKVQILTGIVSSALVPTILGIGGCVVNNWHEHDQRTSEITQKYIDQLTSPDDPISTLAALSNVDEVVRLAKIFPSLRVYNGLRSLSHRLTKVPSAKSDCEKVLLTTREIIPIVENDPRFVDLQTRAVSQDLGDNEYPSDDAKALEAYGVAYAKAPSMIGSDGRRSSLEHYAELLERHRNDNGNEQRAQEIRRYIKQSRGSTRKEDQ